MTVQIKEKMKLWTSIFGHKFKVSRFTSFLSWTRMTSAVLMILADHYIWCQATDASLPEDFDDQYQGLVYTMYGLGGALLAISLSMFPMCYILRKRNMNKDTEGVLKMLKIICYVKSVIDILTFPLDTSGLQEKINDGESVPIWIPITSISLFAIFVMFTSLKIHGIRTRNTKYIKAFIFLQYISFIVVLIGVLTGSIYLSVSLSQFWIFLLGIMVMMCFTFIWIFDMGFIIILCTMLEEKDRNGNVYTKMEEVNVA